MGGLYSEGQFNGGFFCVTGLRGLYLEGLIHGGAYFRNFTVYIGDDDYDDADKSAPLKYRDSPLNGRWNFQKKERYYIITNNYKLVSKILLEIIDNIT